MVMNTTEQPPGLHRRPGIINMIVRQIQQADFHLNLARKYGDVVYFKFGPVDLYLVSHPDPFKFDPERWTPEAKESRPKFAYFPFGGGNRICIGESFAWMEAILILATLAQHWRPRLTPGQQVKPQAMITLRPRRGIKMTLERRDG